MTKAAPLPERACAICGRRIENAPHYLMVSGATETLDRWHVWLCVACEGALRPELAGLVERMKAARTRQLTLWELSA